MELKEELNILEVIHTGDTFKFRLFPQEQLSLGPTYRIFSIKVNESVLQDICLRIDKLHAKNNSDKNGSANRLKEIGALLYHNLIPAGLQQFMRTCGKYLLILTEEPEIPWELLYDGEEFLGLRHSIGRCLMWNEDVPLKPSIRRHAPSFLIIANPADDLPEVEREAATLLSYLKEKGLDCTYLAGPQATTTEMLLQLNSGKYDVIHYCGHIDNALCMAGGQKLDFNEISKVTINAPLIFLNGCSSTKNMLLENQIGNLASAFLNIGAQAVIGSTREVTDPGARFFAEGFYSSILEGETLGEALRKTTQSLYQKAQIDLTWASFVMYGLPNIRLIDKDRSENCLLDPLNFKKFDLQVQEIVGLGLELAQKSNSSLSTIHLFLSILRNPNSIMCKFLGSNLEKTENAFTETVNTFSSKNGAQSKNSRVKFSSNAQKILKIAEEIADSEKSSVIKELHLIKAFEKLDNNEANKILQRLGVDIQQLIQRKDSDIEERMCIQVQIAFYVARGLAYDCGNAVVGTLHLFAGLCILSNGVARRFLESQNIEPEKLFEKISGILLVEDKILQVRRAEIAANYSDNLKIVLEQARELASDQGCMSIEERHLVLSILANSKYSTTKILKNLGVDVNVSALQKKLEKF